MQGPSLRIQEYICYKRSLLLVYQLSTKKVSENPCVIRYVDDAGGMQIALTITLREMKATCIIYLMHRESKLMVIQHCIELHKQIKICWNWETITYTCLAIATIPLILQHH